jgi:hypothetical protein
VLSFVPAVFESYVVLFHPATRHDGSLVRWHEIAAATGRLVGPNTVLDELTGNDDWHNQSLAGVFDVAPAVGELPPVVAEPLVEMLARHTSTAERCWFAVWEGWGALDDHWELRAGPRFEAPHRAYHLLGGPVQDVVDMARSWPPVTPSLWWPEDGAWCVATEIDFNLTYVGCSSACRDALLDEARLEALAVNPARSFR